MNANAPLCLPLIGFGNHLIPSALSHEHTFLIAKLLIFPGYSLQHDITIISFKCSLLIGGPLRESGSFVFD